MWRTKKQVHVALSTAEAEFIAMSMASKELVSVRHFLTSVLGIDNVPIMYEDSTAAIRMAKSCDSQSLKHIVKLCYFHVRLQVAEKNLILKWVSTHEQLADALTKALDRKKFLTFRNKVLKALN